MLNPLLSLLAGCAPEMFNNEAGVSAAPAAEGCATAEAATESVREEAAILAERAEVLAIAADNYSAMWALAIRAGSGTTSQGDREAAVGEFQQRMDLAERIAMDDASVAPGALGLSGARIDHPRSARATSVLFSDAVQQVALAVSALEAEHAELVVEESALLASYPTCRDGVTQPLAVEIAGVAPAEAAAWENASEARGLAQTMGGADAMVVEVVDGMRQLAVNSASETLGDDDRAHLQRRFLELVAEVDRIAYTTEYNEIPLSDGRVRRIQALVGAGDPEMESVTIGLLDLTATALGIDTGSLDLSTAASACAAIDTIDTALGRTQRHAAAMDSIAAVLAVEMERSAADAQ